MHPDQDLSNKFDWLRRQAEDLIKERSDREFQAPTDILDLIHELKIHQAELEIQNEELKRAQQELSELHHEYERLYEFAPCGYVTLNAKGVMTRVNLTAVNLLDTTRHFLMHSSFGQFIASGWQDFFLTARKQAGETEEKQSVELPLKRKKGDPLWVRADIQADRAESGEVIQWRMVLMDITLQKKAETALLESEERFRELFENAPIAYQSLDDRGNLIQVNTTWQDMLGYDKQEVIDKNFSEFIQPKLRNRFKKHFPGVNSIGETLGPEFVMLRKNGAQILVAYQDKIGTYGRGNPAQTHCVLWDITAQRKIEEDKIRIEGQLRQAQKMETVGTLAGGISHEFNNILSIIMGNNELAMDELPNWNPAKQYLEEIRIAGMRARDVVRQLLTFSRRGDNMQTALYITSVVEESLKLIRTSIPKNIDIQQRIPDDIDPVLGNATQINQLIINLCSNAADAMLESGGILTIEMDKVLLDEEITRDYRRSMVPGPYVKIVISDTGCGMDEKTLERIFEPYFTTKEIGKGTGIGLAVVHAIVEQHKGEIRVDSKPDEGTVFTMLLPTYNGPIEDEPDDRIELPGGRERILFVDDEDSIMKLSAHRLERLGYRVKGTADPREAFEILKADPYAFDLVITDMAMPHMTGDELSIKLLNLRPELPIILCTGYSEKISEERAREIGISSFLMKPVDRDEFAVTVRKILDDVKGR